VTVDRSENRHHAARWARRRRHVLAVVRSSEHRAAAPGRYRKLEAGCGGRCYLCKPHKFRKHSRPRVDAGAASGERT